MAGSIFNLDAADLWNKWCKVTGTNYQWNTAKLSAKAKQWHNINEIWNMSIVYPEMSTGESGHQKCSPVQ